MSLFMLKPWQTQLAELNCIETNGHEKGACHVAAPFLLHLFAAGFLTRRVFSQQEHSVRLKTLPSRLRQR